MRFNVTYQSDNGRHRYVRIVECDDIDTAATAAVEDCEPEFHVVAVEQPEPCAECGESIREQMSPLEPAEEQEQPPLSVPAIVADFDKASDILQEPFRLSAWTDDEIRRAVLSVKRTRDALHDWLSNREHAEGLTGQPRDAILAACAQGLANQLRRAAADAAMRATGHLDPIDELQRRADEITRANRAADVNEGREEA